MKKEFKDYYIIKNMGNITLFPRNQRKCFIEPVEGLIYKYNGFPLPGRLNSPYTMVGYRSKRARSAVRIGERSCAVQENGIWYKLKGCAPRGRVFPYFTGTPYDERQPHGSMSCKNATTELVVNGQITEALREHGFKAPHEPVALVKYPVVWEGRRRAFGCILKTRGEQRLRDFMDLHSYYVWDRGWQHDASEQMKPLLAPIAEWIGFSLRVLKEQKIDLDWDSIALENMACFKADGGYGFFLIDHEFSFPDSPLAVSSVRGVKRELREFFGDRLDWERHFYRAYVSGRVPEPIPEAQIKAAFSFG